MAKKTGSLRALARQLQENPAHRRSHFRAEGRSERGAVVAEFALISPLLFFLLAAIIDFSMMFTDYQSLRSGVRESARTASVVTFGNQDNCFLAGMAVNPSNDMRSLMCSTKKYVGLPHDEVRVRIMIADGALTTNMPTAYVPGNAVIVCSMAEQKSLTGMLSSFFEGKTLKSKTAIRIEQMPLNFQQEGYEQPLPGGNWDWCSSPDQVSP